MKSKQQRKPPSASSRPLSGARAMARLAVVLALAVPFVLGGCNLLGGSDSDDGGGGGGSGALSSAAQILTDVVTALNEVPSADSLTAQSADDAVSAQANVDYDSLNAAYSPAYETLNFHVNALLTNVDAIVENLEVFREQIESVDMQPGSPYEDPPNDAGNVLRMQYTTVPQAFDGEELTWFIFTMGEFDSSDSPLGGTYLEVAELPDDGGLTGMCMSVGYQDSRTVQHKVAFDTATGSVTSYSATDEVATEGVEEQGKVRVVPDAEDDVELALKYEGDAYGEITQAAWATDEYGAVVGHFAPPEGSGGNAVLQEEVFAVEGADATVVFRQTGKHTPQYLFERVYIGRSEADTPDGSFWDDGTLKLYSADYEPPAEAAGLAPERLLVQFDGSAEDTSEFSVYTATAEDGGLPEQGATAIFTNQDPDKQGDALDRLFWLEGTETTLKAGDAVYYPLDSVPAADNPDSDMLVTREFYKVAEVPETATIFGYEDEFYVQGMVPLKYLTGTFSDGDTIIQVDEDAIGSGEDAEDRYYVDSNNDGQFATTAQINDGDPPDVELMVWTEQETYYSEEEQQEVTLPAVPWVMGELAFLDDVPLAEESAQVEYTYADEEQAVASHMHGLLDPAETNYFTDTTVDPFPVLDQAWKDIAAADFQ